MVIIDLSAWNAGLGVRGHDCGRVRDRAHDRESGHDYRVHNQQLRSCARDRGVRGRDRESGRGNVQLVRLSYRNSGRGWLEPASLATYLPRDSRNHHILTVVMAGSPFSAVGGMNWLYDETGFAVHRPLRRGRGSGCGDEPLHFDSATACCRLVANAQTSANVRGTACGHGYGYVGVEAPVRHRTPSFAIWLVRMLAGSPRGKVESMPTQSGDINSSWVHVS